MASRTNISLVKFTVEGSGLFPYDMLRYDGCWPYTGEDASMLYPHHRNEKRKVKMCMVSFRNGGPTAERWQSFGWTVLNDSDATG